MPAKSRASPISSKPRSKDPCAEWKRKLKERDAEFKEAREQLAAVSDILRIISSSPTNLQPVFDAILDNATRLCDAHMGILSLYDGDKRIYVAQRGGSAEYVNSATNRGPVQIPLGGTVERMLAERRPIQSADLRDFSGYRDRTVPGLVALVELGGARSHVNVPMLKEGRVVGDITIYRPEVRQFSQRQIDLVSTFAHQAVIAIENVRLFNETKEALDQQTATSDVLRVIASTPTDLAPVLEAVIESAVKLAGATQGHIRRFDGEVLHVDAHYGESAEQVAALKRSPLTPQDDDSPTARSFREKRIVNLSDAQVDRSVNARAIRVGARTLLAVPLLREGTAIGVITIWRNFVEPFTERQIDLVRTFADQAVIAIANVRLFNELQTRNAEVTEALEQQTATADILKVISSSPTDIQPVLNAVAARAAQLCEAFDSVILLRQDDFLRFAAHYGQISLPALGQSIPLTRRSMSGHCVLEAKQFHVHDLQAETEAFPDASARAREYGTRTQLATPLLRDGTAMGALIIRRNEVRPFSDKQIALLRTFADEAVIAIENVRLFKELQTRNAEITEALEQQTATAEILKVISSSPTNLQPVFDAILENATRLCDAHMANLSLYDDDRRILVAQRGGSDAYVNWATNRGLVQVFVGSNTARVIAERRPIQSADLRDSSSYRDRAPGAVALVELAGARTFVVVPMIKEGRVVGGIAIYRPEVRPFTQKQIDLVSTFANQAVIAIDNVRLFNETKEALEQQTATAEILRVISESPTDTQPVFDAIVNSAVRLFGGLGVTLRLVKDDQSEAVATTIPGVNHTIALSDDRYAVSRAILRREVVHVPDVLAEAWVREESKRRAAVRGRAILCAPLLREDGAIGAILVNRANPGPFSEKQIALLQTFAAQAVIAIENVRLFKELQARNAEITEALEQQTATAEILKVISSSPADIQPVFDAVAESAARLCGAHDVVIRLVEGNVHRAVAHHGSIPAMPPRPLTRAAPVGRAIFDARTVHIPDVAEPHVIEEYPATRTVATGQRTFLAVPLVREDRAIGVIGMRRMEVRPFTDREIKLLETFATQAVIAIANVRLFNETKEALERQTASSEILASISHSISDTKPVFDAIVNSVLRLFGTRYTAVFMLRGDQIDLAALKGGAHFEDYLRATFPQPLDPHTLTGRVLLSGQVEQLTPIIGNPEASNESVELARKFDYNSMIIAPMVGNGKVIGAIATAQRDAILFDDKQVALLKTFADQAVIAIENVRLLNELQTRNAELSESLEQQTATSEILRIISGSPTDIQPVLDAVAESAARLCNTEDVYIRRIDADTTRIVAQVGKTPLPAEGVVRPLQWGTIVGTVARECKTIHIVDVTRPHVVEKYPDSLTLAGRYGVRTLLYVPLLREGVAIGVIAMRRREVRPFTDKQIKLLETFADQAVIAIENVRLFNEVKARTEELTRSVEEMRALGEVGQAVSSTLDLQTVLMTIITNAVELSKADGGGTIYEFDEATEVFEPRASHGVSDAYVQTLHELRIRLGESAVGMCAVNRTPLQVPDVWSGENNRVRDTLLREGIRSVLALPLLREERVIGALVIRRKAPGTFSPTLVTLLQNFASQSVLAIENARLFQQIQTASYELRAASQHKSEFLANMSHELRTPLNAVIGFSEVLQQGMVGALNDKQGEYIEYIHKSGSHLLSLINDILDLSKVEAGRMELDLTSFNVPLAIDNALTLVKERATRHGLTLDCTLDPAVADIHADERKFKQVMLNLLSNAVKFTPEGGRITVAARPMNDTVEVSVTDTGIGISPEDCDAVFEEFRQVGSHSDAKAQGTGLGLALTRKFIELHGGKIWLTSTLGEGSTVSFTLPVTQPTQAVA